MERFEPEKKKIKATALFDEVQKLLPQNGNVEISYHIPKNLAVFTDEHYMKTILRNLTANAIKAVSSKTQGKVAWKAWEENGNVFFSITDNGPGFSQEQIEKLYDNNAVISTKTGLGLHLVRDLTRMLQHKLTTTSIKGEGATITIALN